MPRDEAEAIYGAYFPNFDANRHRIAMEWTVSYIANETVLDRIREFYGDDPTFILASREPIGSFLSSYFYFRTKSNDSLAARLSQSECLDRYPELFVAPFLVGTHYRQFRQHFPKAPLIIVPQEKVTHSSAKLIPKLFDALNLSPLEKGPQFSPANLSYPYRSWRFDKLIRWTLVQVFGNRRTKILYHSPNHTKPALMRLLHRLNRAPYRFEPDVEDRVAKLLLPDFKDFVAAATTDEHTVVLGSRGDLAVGLV